MLKCRVIPCLDVKDGRVVKGVNFVNLRDAGDPVACAIAYDEAGDEELDTLLTLVDCQITYRSRYLVAPLLAPVRDLAVLDSYNPRSVAFQVEALNEHIASLPALKETGLIERPQRLAVGLRSTLATAEAATLDVKTLFALEQDLLSLADAIGAHYFPHGPNASRPEKLTGLA